MSAFRTQAFMSAMDRSSLDLLSRRFLFCSAVLVLAPSCLEKTASARTNAETQNVTGSKLHAPHTAKRQGAMHAHKPAAVSAVESVRSEAVSVHGAISTSRRQILKRQNDPVSVTTVTEKDLQTHQITNLPQATSLLPSVSLQVSNPRNTAINIRGLGNFSSTAQDGLENGTAVYIDGVYQTRPGAVLGDISDLAGIEVLKGPQGTRGGIDNDSGTINITTLAPSFKRQYTVTGDYGSYNTANIRVRATGAVGNSDKVAYSLSGFSMNRDGYVKNVTTNKYYQDYHTLGAKAQLLAKPTEGLTIRLIGDYTHLRESCCITPMTTALSNYSNGEAISGSYWDRAAYAGAEPVPKHGVRDMLVSGPASGSQAVDQETYGVSLNVGYQLPNQWKLENIASWRTWFWYPHNALSDGAGNTPGLQLWSADNNQVYEQNATEELRISSPENRRYQVTGGVFYMYEEVPDYIHNTITAQGAKYLGYGYGPEIYNAALNGASQLAHDNPITNEVAGYVRGKYKITSKLEVEGGFRYSFVSKSGGYSSRIVNSAIPAMAADVFGAPVSYHATHREHEPSGSLSVVYRLNENHMLYATYSRGVRNGGINLVNLDITEGANPDVKPEINDMFEFGLKNTFLHKRLFVNATAFWNNVHNYITSASYYTSGGTTISYLTNAKHVISRGFELDARGVIIPGLEGRVSASYTDAFYASFNNATHPLESSNMSGLYSLTGNQVPLNSKWNLSTGLEYTVPIKNIGGTNNPFWSKILFYVGADYRYRSQYYAEPSESRYTRIKPYGILDAHVGIRPESGKWDLSFWGHNMLDKRYFVTMTSLSAGAVFYGQLGDPAMFGGEFTYRM